jgi:hypothetical protein
MFSKLTIFTLLAAAPALASFEAADKIYGSGSISLSGYRRTILELVRDGYYFSAAPWMKDFLVRNSANLDQEMEAALDSMLYHTGVKPFETLPEEVLKRSRSASVRYILAKHFLQRGRHHDALNELSGIREDHPVYPFVANMRGTLYSHLGQHKDADASFKDCIGSSERRRGRSDSQGQRDQLAVNRDLCVAGTARVQFAAQDFRRAESIYLDIPKDSFIWPEILFEEAWTSYYMRNYNRTLGKLVTYRAPVFDFIFKPEVEVLKALTYLKMCLYDDARKTVDEFYGDLLNPSRDLRNYLMSHGKDYRHYYTLMAEHEENKLTARPLVVSILKSVRKDAAFIELKGALTAALAEFNQLRKRPASSLQANLMKNIQTLMGEYRTLIGAYVRAAMVNKYAELYAAFQGMSYIKLEVLAQRKERLYQSDTQGQGKRGDVRYIDRNDKQYFWTFNGEFWADELGDYVFALRSEC